MFGFLEYFFNISIVVFLTKLNPVGPAENHGHFLEFLLLKQLLSDWFLLVPYVFSANQKAFVICTRVTEELHSFLSQSELSNFFVYIIKTAKQSVFLRTFKYTRAVEQKVWNKAEKEEGAWEDGRVGLARFAREDSHATLYRFLY